MNMKRGKTLHASALARLAEGAACRAGGSEIAAIRAAGVGRRVDKAARQLAMYLAHVRLALSMHAVGRSFGRDRSTVRHACARIEDRREDAGFEHGIAALEAALLVFALRFGPGACDRHGRPA